MDLCLLPARKLKELLLNGEISARELVDAFLARIRELDGKLGAFLHVDEDGARQRARELDVAKAKGQAPGPLFGLPIALKDNISVQGWPLRCASKILDGYTASYDATVVQRIKGAGGIPIGSCNMDEFGFGSSTEHSAYQETRNPWQLDRIPGGSSGGSAAAVAARMVPFALGSDTGGSIRQPAALCGVSGLKPSYGRVSRFGLVAFGSSLDQIGPICHDVEDMEFLFEVLSGKDVRDATSLDEPRYACWTREGEEHATVRGMRIGVPAEYLSEEIDADVTASVKAALAKLEAEGATLVEVSLPMTQYAIPCYYLIATSEASSNLARFDGIRYGKRVRADKLRDLYLATREQGFGAEAKRRILLGAFCLSAGYYDAYYHRASKVRAAIQKEFEDVFQDVDVICGPTSPVPPYRIGERIEDPLAMYFCDLLTIPANLAGIPALSIPCGKDRDGMPIGLQIQGPKLGEAKIFRAARCWQRLVSLHEELPTELLA